MFGWKLIMNRKGREKKRVWPDSRRCPRTGLEGRGKAMKTLGRIIRFWAEPITFQITVRSITASTNSLGE
jgi:hypothetical protein